MLVGLQDTLLLSTGLQRIGVNIFIAIGHDGTSTHTQFSESGIPENLKHNRKLVNWQVFK